MPPAFSLTFFIISLAWAFYGFHFTNQRVAPWLQGLAHGSIERILPFAVSTFLFDQLHFGDFGDLIMAVVVLGSCFVGFVFAYNIAMGVNWLWFRSIVWPLHFEGGFTPVIPSKKWPLTPPFSAATKIGIVLAGGGAKGAYQAGAMKAVYEYLEHHGALANVKVIAGTSVGSWNAMFWLAGLIKSPRGWSEPGCHEWWWKRLKAKYLVAPRRFIPGRHNAFLSSAPWERQFDQIFGSEEMKAHLFNSNIHFYMTRSNVRSAGLECATNNPDPKAVNRVRYRKLKYDPRDDDELPAAGENTQKQQIDEFFAKLKMAVFASMDLPPLFPYIASEYELYEDGGVIDNLPLSFPAAEGCDMIFILPLNSDFEDEPNSRSFFVRISRVIDVQQGALERHGFKLLYLYNENAALRERVRELEGNSPGSGITPEEPSGTIAMRGQPFEFAMQRKHKEIKVFAVCPDKSFVRSTLDTRDLWNTAGAKIAFDIMYDTTAQLLEEYDFGETQKAARVALIRRAGSHIFDHDF